MSSTPEAPRLVRLGLQLGFANLAHIAIGTTDVAMIGRLGGLELAAGGLGATLSLVFVLTGMGFAAGAGPLLARARGAVDGTAFTGTLGAVALLLVGFAVIASTILALGETVLLAAGQSPDVAAAAGPYMGWLAVSLPFSLVFGLQWTAASATGNGGVIFWISILAIGMNALGNYAFMFGVGAIPAMGLAGAGASTCLTAVMKVLLIALWHARETSSARTVRCPSGADISRQIRPVLVHGLPMAALEIGTMGFFAALALVAGLSGSLTLAAHTVAIQIAELGIGLAFGFSEAAAIAVAFALGKGDTAGVRRAVRLSLTVGGGFMLVYALAIALGRDFVAPMFVGPATPLAEEVAAVVRSVVPVAALCLAADSGRIVLVGILRGFGDTRWPIYMNMVAFWLVALPAATYLALGALQGPVGLWFGMAMGMGCASIALFLRLSPTLSR